MAFSDDGGTAAAYRWTDGASVGATLPVSLPHPVPQVGNALDRVIDGTVHAVLSATGLLSILDDVTGAPESLSEAADLWLAQAHAVAAVAEALRQGGASLPGSWQGEASSAFGRYMGEVVDGLDTMAGDMGFTAQTLHEAAEETQNAQDLVNEIIREAIEYTMADAVATGVADLFTFGLATFVGGFAESVEMTAFVARASQVSARLGEGLERLMEMLANLREVKETQGTFTALRAFRAMGKTGKAIRALRDGDFATAGAIGAVHVTGSLIKGQVVGRAMDVGGVGPGQQEHAAVHHAIDLDHLSRIHPPAASPAPPGTPFTVDPDSLTTLHPPGA
jgi:hypothetical protein